MTKSKEARDITIHNLKVMRMKSWLLSDKYAIDYALLCMNRLERIEQIVNNWDDDENAMILADEIKEVFKNE